MRKVLCGLLALVFVTGTSRAVAESKSSSGPMPGEEIAQTASMITGVAISPLVGVSAVGAWKYFKADTPEKKAKLPWFANPLGGFRASCSLAHVW